MKRHKRLSARLLSILLMVAMVSALLPVTAFAAEITVSDFDTFKNAVTNASDGDVIKINASFAMTATVTIPESITIQGVGDGIAITRGTYYVGNRMFTIGSSSNKISATFENLTIDGDSVISSDRGAGLYISDGNTLILKDVVVQNCVTSSDTGGGIYVGSSSSTLSMTGGAIKNNATTTGEGGGVYMNSNSIMTIHGGIITGNSCADGQEGGGIFAGGKLSIAGNVNISGNQAGTANNNTYISSPSGYWASPIVVTGPLDASSTIGVSSTGQAAKGDGYTLVEDDVAKFVSDDPNLSFFLSGSGTSAIIMAPTAISKPITIDTAAPVNAASIVNGTATTLTGANAPVITWSADGGLTFVTASGSFAEGIAYQTKYVYTAKTGYVFDSSIVATDISVTNIGAGSKTIALSNSNQTLTITVTWPATAGAELPEYGGAQAEAPSGTPVSKTDTAITLTAVTAPGGETIEYAYSTTSTAPTSDADWQDSTAFPGLTADAQYYFFARVKANGSHKAGAASAGTAIQTDKSDAQKVAAAKILTQTALGNFTAANATTADDVLGAINAALTGTGVTATWDASGAFRKTEASNSGAGSITGTIKLSCNTASDTVPVNLTIAQLGGGAAASGNTGSSVTVDGKPENIGKVENKGDTTTVVVDSSKLDSKVSAARDGSSVTIPISTAKDSAAAQLVVESVEKMAAKDMTLEVKAGKTAYSLPAAAIDTASVLTQLGAADASKVSFTVTITKEKNVTVEGSILVIPAVRFTVTAGYNGKSVTVNRFDAMVERTIEVTREQAAKVTTAVVVEQDGTVRHVPTRVYEQGGKWYAEVSSRSNSTYALISNNSRFTDVSGKWFEAAANELSARQVTDGVFGTTFAGEKNITRAEFAALLVNAFGLPKTGKADFSDVSTDAWYAEAVAAAVAYGIITGYSDGAFKPDTTITRQQAMVMIQRAAELVGYTGGGADNGTFSDRNLVGAWAAEGVAFNLANGLIVGNGGKINPTGVITRAQTATVLLRLLQKAGLVDVRSQV